MVNKLKFHEEKDVEMFCEDVLDTATFYECRFFPVGKSTFRYDTEKAADEALFWFAITGAHPLPTITHDAAKNCWTLSADTDIRLEEIATDWPIERIVEPYLAQYLQHLKSHTSKRSDGSLCIDCSGEPDQGNRLFKALSMAVNCGILKSNGALSFEPVGHYIMIYQPELAREIQALAGSSRTAISQKVDPVDLWASVVAVAKDPIRQGDAGRERPAHWLSEMEGSTADILGRIDAQKKAAQEIARRNRGLEEGKDKGGNNR